MVYWTAAISLAIHFLLLGSFVSGLVPLSAPPPEPAKQEDLGDEKGLPENVNVSLITDADLKSLSSDPFKSVPNLTPPPQTAPSLEPPQESQQQPQQQEQQQEQKPEQQQPQQKEQQQQEKPEKPAEEQQKAKPLPRTIDDPNGYAARAAAAFAAQVTQAFAEIERRKTTPSRPTQSASQPVSIPNLHFFRPAATHSGKSDEFARQVAWALAATKPQGNGTYGSTIVTFVVDGSGRVEGLRLLKSSGDNWLDTGALLAVKQARMPVPPGSLPPGDRTFNVEYISRPF